MPKSRRLITVLLAAAGLAMMSPQSASAAEPIKIGFGMGLTGGLASSGKAALLGWLAEGKIRPLVHARLPLAEARSAHEMLEAGEVIGKLLLKP